MRKVRIPQAKRRARMPSHMSFAFGNSKYIRVSYAPLPRAPSPVRDRQKRPRQLPHEDDGMEPERKDGEEPVALADADTVIEPVKQQHEEQSSEIYKRRDMVEDRMRSEEHTSELQSQ